MRDSKDQMIWQHSSCSLLLALNLGQTSISTYLSKAIFFMLLLEAAFLSNIRF